MLASGSSSSSTRAFRSISPPSRTPYTLPSPPRTLEFSVWKAQFFYVRSLHCVLFGGAVALLESLNLCRTIFSPPRVRFLLLDVHHSLHRLPRNSLLELALRKGDLVCMRSTSPRAPMRSCGFTVPNSCLCRECRCYIFACLFPSGIRSPRATHRRQGAQV
jgi:hypothetical protein